jgi:hypothetical protein
MRPDLEIGDAVLIGDREPLWAGCLMRVDAVRSWGVIGTITGPNSAFYPLRLAYADIVTVFRALKGEKT